MPTLRDVARLAKVSTCTASKVLAGDTRSRFRPVTAEAVRAAARKLGWTADHRARSLRTGKAGAIALVMPGTSGSSFSAAVLSAADTAVRPSGLSLVLAGGSNVEGAFATASRLAEERRVDGIIAMGWGMLDAHAALLAGLTLPTVVIGDHPAGHALAHAQLDDAAGLHAAMAHLHGLGHRRVAWLPPAAAASKSSAHVQLRRAAVLTAATQLGMTLDDIDLEPSPERSAAATIVAGVQAALRTTPPWSAVISYNDAGAMAAIAALQMAGRSVPRDVSIVGFDDVIAAECFPALTTVSHELGALMEAAVRMVLDPELPRSVTVTPRVVVRDSSGPARA